jgi:hypothetical protein
MTFFFFIRLSGIIIKLINMNQPAYLIRPVVTFAVFLFLLSLSACKKDKAKEISGTEISDVRTEGNLKTVMLAFTPGTETITAITLKNTSGGTGTSVHVKLSPDDAAVTAAKLMPLPANAYTLATLEYDVPVNGTMAVPLVIDRSNLTVDTTYGIGFVISEVSEGAIAADAKNIVVKISLRNRWDGLYKVTGTLVDASEPTISFPEHDIYLVTTSTTQVKMIPVLLGIEGILIKFGSNLSFYGSFGPVLTFDAANNKVTSLVNFYGQPAADTRSGELDPSGSNVWNAATKKMDLKYWMNQPSVIAGHRAAFNNTFTYVRER